MPLRLNGVEIDDLSVNGVQVERAYLNGTEVYSSINIGDVLSDGGIIYGKDGGDWLACAPASKRYYEYTKWGLYDVRPASLSSSDPDSYTGRENTNFLISNYRTFTDIAGTYGVPAARKARQAGAVYDLPNIQELRALYQNRSLIDANDSSGGAYTLSYIANFSNPGWPTVSSNVYSSTIKDRADARGIRFNGGSNIDIQKDRHAWVIPVRRFRI